MEQKRMKLKIIYARKVCEQLMMMGFRPVDIMPNPLKPEFLCWAFEWTDEFDDALCEVLGGMK